MRMICQEGYDDITIAHVNQLCQQRFGDAVELDRVLPSLHFDLGTISSVAGLIVGLVSLCLQMRKRKKSRTNPQILSESEATDHVMAELQSMEVITIQEVHFRKFSNLTGMNGQACEVSARESSIRREWKVFVSLTDIACTISKKASHD